MEWLVIAMNCKVESPVPRYEYSGINGISENPNCFTIDLGNVVFKMRGKRSDGFTKDAMKDWYEKFQSF